MNSVNIYLEANPNPNSLKFVADRMLLDDKIIKDYPDAESATDSEIAKKLFDFDYVELMRILYAIKFVVQKIEKNEVFLEDTWQRNERRDPEESKNALKKLKALVEVLHLFGPVGDGLGYELYAETKKMIEDVLASFELEIKMATQESGEAGPSGVDHSKDGEEENG